MIASLEGAAAEAVWGFKVEKDGDYEKIWEMLQRRFGFIDESERAKRNLETRKQGDNESITLFEQGLRALFREAWPQMDLKNPDSDGMVQRLFVNGIRDGALQKYLRLHARGDTFPQTLEKARIFVEANELSAATGKPAVRFAQNLEKSTDISAEVAEKILEGLNKLLHAVEQDSRAKSPPPPAAPTTPTISQRESENTSRDERGRHVPPTTGTVSYTHLTLPTNREV